MSAAAKVVWCACCGRLDKLGGVTQTTCIILSWKGVALLRRGVCVCEWCCMNKTVEEWTHART